MTLQSQNEAPMRRSSLRCAELADVLSLLTQITETFLLHADKPIE
jgi:hypothetical protein